VGGGEEGGTNGSETNVTSRSKGGENGGSSEMVSGGGRERGYVVC